MIDYSVTGRAMTLSEQTSRACGHLVGFNGEDNLIDEPTARRVRSAVRRDAQVLADKLGKSIEIFASHPSAQDWIVDCVEPS